MAPYFLTTTEGEGTEMHRVPVFYKQKTLGPNQLHMLLHYLWTLSHMIKSLMLTKVKRGGGLQAGGEIRSLETA